MQTISGPGSNQAFSADNEDCFSTDAAFLCNNIQARKWMERALNASSSTPPAIHLSARVAGAVSRTEGWEGRVIERGRTSFIMPLSPTIPPRELRYAGGGIDENLSKSLSSLSPPKHFSSHQPIQAERPSLALLFQLPQSPGHPVPASQSPAGLTYPRNMFPSWIIHLHC